MTAKPRIRLRLVPRPLAKLVEVEARIRGRDFKAEPFMLGEGPRFWTPERVARLAADNEQRRAMKGKHGRK